MGVKDLWQLLAPIGRRVSIETLEGKVLAIDMSIWLTQFVKAMRDEDGKMIKNAHLIGTLRRVLKLMFHKIRPVFVFDGETPVLKARTIQQRRKVHERHESNRRAAIHRLILNQLKQQLQEQLKAKSEDAKTSTELGSNYAPGFNPIIPKSNIAPSNTDDDHESPSNIVQKRKQITAKPEVDLDDVEWEEIKPVKRKRLEEEENSSEEDPEEPSWDLPDNHDELNIEVLSSLPSELRKRIVEDARRKERVKSRATFIPVADNPALYSQTQLANFLNTSKLNRRFEEVQKKIDGDNQGKSIAAEGHKKYMFVQNNKHDLSSLLGQKTPFASSSSGIPNHPSSSTTTSGGFLVDGDDDVHRGNGSQSEDEFTARDWTTAAVPATSSSSRSRVQVAPTDTEDMDMYDTDDAYDLHGPSSSSSAKPVVSKKQRLRKGAASSGTAVPPDNQDDTPVLANVTENKKSLRWETMVEREDEDNEAWLQELEEEAAIAESIKLFESGSKEIEEVDLTRVDDEEVKPVEKPLGTFSAEINLEFDVPVKVDKTFYHDLHCSDVEEDDVDDIEWDEEAEEVPTVKDNCTDMTHNASSPSREIIVEFDNSSIVTDAQAVKTDAASVIDATGWSYRENEEEFAEQKAKEIMASLEHGEEFMEMMNENSNHGLEASLSSSNNSALDRAVVTASNMADWAGRAVRRALREHLKPKELTPSVAKDNSKAFLSSSVSKSEHIPAEDVHSSSSSSHWQTTQHNAHWEPPARLDLEDDQSHQQPSTDAPGLLAPYNDTYEDDPKVKRSMQTSSRDADKVTEEMKEEVLNLIKAFNLPYLIAPFEAEAQCAVLEQLGLVDGVITEDSDAFLFGAQAVYKNIFSDKKYVEVYLTEDAKREMGISREDLISLAFFLGSDYTEGVNGVGIVNAMEILHAFPMKMETGGIMAGLLKFKDWLRGYDFASDILMDLEAKKKAVNDRKDAKEAAAKKSKSAKRRQEDSETEDDEADESHEVEEEFDQVTLTALEGRMIAFDRKHKNGRSKWIVPDNFPDPKVIEAYLEPQANRSTEPFPWMTPSRTKIRDFCRRYLDWTEAQLDLQVDPVLQKYEERSAQTRIDSHFMTYHDDNRFAKIASERLRNTVIQITGKSTDLTELPVASSSSRGKRANTSTTNTKGRKKKQVGEL